MTGCTKLASLDDLAKEAGWESLQDRRLKHKLILYFKMVKGLSPNSLSSLVPQSVGSITPYGLCGSHNNRIPQCRTELYKKSFLPAVIEEWNELPIEIRNEDSLSCFKYYLNRDKPSPNKLYFIGERKLQVIHTQIRNKCSSLNNHLFLKNIVDSPLCTCGGIETSEHFLFECNNYDAIRTSLFNAISVFGNIDLEMLLFGKGNLLYRDNEKIFLEVQKFIRLSSRFPV